MNRHIFFWNIMARVGLLIATAFLFVWLAQSMHAEFVFTLVMGSFLIVLQVYLLTRYVLGITRVIEQFVDAIGREETPEIQFDTGKALFQRLKERSNSIKKALNAGRMEKEKDDRILRHVINSAEPAMLCFNELGVVQFMNESGRKLAGKQDLSHLDELKAVNEKLWESLYEVRSGSPRVVRLSRKENAGLRSEQLLSVRLKEVRIFDESYRLFVLQDIQEELHKNESDSWQKIIRVLTHEIMNAVSPMLSLSKSLKSRIGTRDSRENEKLREGLSMIESTGKGLIDFVEEYRRLSLLPPPKKKELELKRALEGVMMMFEEEAREKHIRLQLITEDSGETVFADPQQFALVLLNLLRNAIESFTDERQDKAIHIRTRRIGNRIQLRVEDNGSGIAEELVDQVFVPFFSTKEQGSGIGLSLARQVMNRHDGSIDLESSPGKGTVVSLLFN
jgi:nitrogen fixation/metabolism regulation signal transduction histidine kinase